MEIVVMSISKINPNFWKDKKVFLTGHTGFKGSWLSLWLTVMGAKVTGYALSPNTNPSLYELLRIDSLIEKSYISDIREMDNLKRAMLSDKPDILIHMAAQPLVRYAYDNPVETYAINVMGTVHVLESARTIDNLGATLVVTTDKCYKNNEWVWGYRETEPMGGYDPYSSSKGCVELVTDAYRQSYFSNRNILNNVASARAGNVIGGGDWSKDRLIPDAIKSFEVGKNLLVRNPSAKRPWQHVLEPLSGYLILAQKLYEDGQAYTGAWNFGPRDEDNRSVEEVLELLISYWGSSAGWKVDSSEKHHEANLLKLDCSKAQSYLGWMPKWPLEIALQKIVEWHKAYQANENMQKISLIQIDQYMGNQ